MSRKALIKLVEDVREIIMKYPRPTKWAISDIVDAIEFAEESMDKDTPILTIGTKTPTKTIKTLARLKS